MKDDRSIFREERQEQIKQLLRQKRRVTVPELSEKFQVTDATIRTDIINLEREGILIRTHGGAIYKSTPSRVGLEPTPSAKSALNIKEKIRIAKKASEYVDDGDVLAVLTGTTGYEFVKTLGRYKNLTIVVNDLRAALYLEEETNHQIYVPSGFVRSQFHYIAFAEADIQHLHIDKIFFSSNGLDYDAGATIPDLMLARAHQAIIKQSAQHFLLCDSSKLGHISFACISKSDELDYIITDNTRNHELLKPFLNSDFCQVDIV